MHGVATSTIVLPSILITATSIVLCYVARKERREALDQADKFGEVAFDCLGDLVKALGKIEKLEMDLKIYRTAYETQTAKLEGSDDLSKQEPQKSASPGSEQPPQPSSSSGLPPHSISPSRFNRPGRQRSGRGPGALN